MSIFSLAYVSSASGFYTKDTYRDIAIRSHGYNKSHGISGLLLVYNDTIIQFLEGVQTEVEALYKRIEVDPRHKSPIVISTRNLDSREFPDWSMGYKEMVDMKDPGFLFYLNSQSLPLHIPQSITPVSNSLIASFARGSGLNVT